jgi:translocator protein
MPARSKLWLGLCQFVLWYIPVVIVQLLASLITFESTTSWYPSLHQPSWNPPASVFGPVWTLLYFSMALAAWLVYRTEAQLKQKRVAYILFFAQLFLNGLWSFIFFGWQAPGWALIELTLLVALIAATTSAFYRIRPIGGIILIPYLLWSIYALTLNAAVWWLNRSAGHA